MGIRHEEVTRVNRHSFIATVLERLCDILRREDFAIAHEFIRCTRRAFAQERDPREEALQLHTLRLEAKRSILTLMLPEGLEGCFVGLTSASLLCKSEQCISALTACRDHDDGSFASAIVIDDDIQHRQDAATIIQGLPPELQDLHT